MLAGLLLTAGAGVALQRRAVDRAVTARLALPDAGSITPVVLDDGTPAFLGLRPEGEAAPPGGDVWVVAAVPPGSDTAVVFCRATGQFVDPSDGSRFDPRGRYVGGPATSGLVPYRTERDGDALAVGAPFPAYERLPYPAVDTAAHGEDCLGDDGTVEGDVIRH